MTTENTRKVIQKAGSNHLGLSMGWADDVAAGVEANPAAPPDTASYYARNPFSDRAVSVEEEYRETDWVICPLESGPHKALNCTIKNSTRLYAKIPIHKHTFALVCTGCGVGETE